MSIFRVISICMILLVNYGCTGKVRQGQPSEAVGGLYDRLQSYWTDVDVANLPEDSLEQQIVDYLFLAGHLERDERDRIWPDFYEHLNGHPNKTVVEYLGEPDSPLYSPELLEEYLSNIQRLVDDETARIRAEYLLENIRKNQPGTIISDLNLLRENRATSLHHLINETDNDSLIVFYDPDCSSCDALFERLKRIDLTDLRIITISITESKKDFNPLWVSALIADEDEFEAKFYYTSLPSIYIVSRDGTIKQKDISL